MHDPEAVPVEWVIRSARSQYPAAIVRLLHLGPSSEPYYRAVTYSPNPAHRELIGYWGTLDDAIQNIRHFEMSQLDPSRLAIDGKTFRTVPPATPQKPPPGQKHDA